MAHHAINTHRASLDSAGHAVRILLLAGFFLCPPSGYAWYYAAEPFRFPAAVVNATTQTPTNQPVLLLLDTAALITAEQLRADGADLRITSHTDTPLPFWIEPNTINTTNTRVWIGLNSLPSNDTATVYLYHGETNAAAAGNITNTFTALLEGDSPLVLSWPLDESSGTGALDYSGLNHHATLQNDPERITGKYLNAIRFSGTNQLLSASSAASLNLTNGFTLEGWIYATPLPLPVTNDLLMHFDASTITGLAHNAAVPLWNDLSGNAYHATQTTNAARPVYQTNAINGKPAVLFQGAQTLITPLKPGASDLATGFTLFILCTPTDNGFALGSWGDIRFYFGVWTDALQSGYGDAWVRVGAPNLDTTRLFRLQHNGTDTRLYANGTIIHTNEGVFTGTNDAVITLGNAHGTDRWFNGHLAEIVLYRRSLSAAEISNVEQFLNHKWLGQPATRTAPILAKGTNAYRLEWNLDSQCIQGGVNTNSINATPATGRWQHVAFTYNRTNMVLYLDGIPRTSSALSAAINPNASTLIAGLVFPGALDELRIYQRALTSNEIALSAALYGYATTNDPGNMLLGTTPYYQFALTRGAAETVSRPDSMPPARNPQRLDPATALYISFLHGPGAADASRHAHTVTERGTWLAPGRHQLNGNGDYLTIPDAPSLDDSPAMTFSIWINLHTLPATNVGILAKENAYALSLTPAGTITIDLAGDAIPISSNSALETNQLYQLTIVFDGSLPEAQRLRIHLNGRLDKTAAASHQTIPRAAGADLLIGALLPSDSETLNATIGPVTLLRRALGLSEINAAHQTALVGIEGLQP
ncbi:MAG: DUF2341 domain-containing protein [Kiritimatiellae bacterium]|nr:DUF2341 domain-containing protein [Kiritimatiellia bacterium]